MDLFSKSATLASGQTVLQVELPGYFVDYIPGGQRLVVTFESANGQTERPDGARDSWGQKFLLAAGFAIVAVKPKVVEWYRGRDLHAFFRDPRFVALATNYDQRLFYGSSMGGFAALSFAAAVPGSNVLAHVPQSTLAPDLVPWERRFIEGRCRDWSGDFRDAAEGVRLSKKAYVTYDPFYKPDAMHVRRLEAKPLCPLKVPFASHGVPEVLLQLGIIKDLVLRAAEGAEDFFPALVRARKHLPSYYVGMAQRSRRPRVQMACLQRAAAIDPNNRDVLFTTYQQQYRLKDYKGCITTAARLGGTRHLKNQRKLFVLSTLARCHIEIGDRAEALRIVQKIRERHTEDLRFYQTMIGVCADLGEFALAADLAAKAMSLAALKTSTAAPRGDREQQAA